MIRDLRPYYLKALYKRVERVYVRRRLAPQLAGLGPGWTFMKPWFVEVFGWPVTLGAYVNVIAAPDMRVRLSVWSDVEGEGRIEVGDYCLICPGVRLSSAKGVFIGDGTMLAHGVYVTDSDWHDLYNRAAPCRNPAAVHIGRNVWVGDSAIVCKGASIGDNSVIGAGAVVVGDVPADTVAAGNPARPVKRLDPDKERVTRADWFQSHDDLFRRIDDLDRQMLNGNTTFSYLKGLFFPGRGE